LVELLLGAVPGTPAGMTVSRLAGLALLALAVACWLAREDAAGRAAKGLVAAMLFYNIAVVAILVLAWTNSGLFGRAFWPVVLAHTGLAAWCVADLSMRTLEEKKFYRNLAFQLDTPSSILKRLANWKFGHDLIAKYPKRADP
jgi:hypothetical protein